MRVTRGVLVELRPRKRKTLRELGADILRHADPDDGFGYVRELKKDARNQARVLGHDLARFSPRPYDKSIFNANCARCQALVVVSVEPRQGERHIYGPGVVERCP